MAITNHVENNIGQAMGAKGLRTRRTLIDATVGLLEHMSLRDVRVAHVTRAARTSSATFYVYFETVQDVVLAAVEEISQSPSELLDMLAAPWPRAEARAMARKFVKIYVDVWQTHRTIFRVRNLASEEGDERFKRVREQSIRPLLVAMADRIEASGGGDSSAPAFAQAGILAAMLERLSAIYQGYRNSEQITGDQLVEAAALVLAERMAANNN